MIEGKKSLLLLLLDEIFYSLQYKIIWIKECKWVQFRFCH